MAEYKKIIIIITEYRIESSHIAVSKSRADDRKERPPFSPSWDEMRRPICPRVPEIKDGGTAHYMRLEGVARGGGVYTHSETDT